jgi:hypothetical protein
MGKGLSVSLRPTQFRWLVDMTFAVLFTQLSSVQNVVDTIVEIIGEIYGTILNHPMVMQFVTVEVKRKKGGEEKYVVLASGN